MSDSKYFLNNQKNRDNNCEGNLHFKFKAKPLNECLSDYKKLFQGDLKQFIDVSDSHYDFQVKSRHSHYLCLLKSHKIINEIFLVNLDERIVTISQFSLGEEARLSLQGFSHSFEIPFEADLRTFEVYSQEHILIIIIPRY